MKWFKHIATSLSDPDIFESISLFGGDGYLCFFGTLELMAQEFDVMTPGIVRVPFKLLTKNLQLSGRKVTKILSFFQQKTRKNTSKLPRLSFVREGPYIVLNCPKLKELCDEWTKKQLKKLGINSGVTPDLLPPIEEEEEEEEEKKKPPIPPSVGGDDGKPKKPKKHVKRKVREYSSRFQAFWSVYPRRHGKGEASDIFEELVEMGIDVGHLIEQAAAYGKWCKATERDQERIAHPSTWLNQGRYDDDYTLPGHKPEVDPFDKAVFELVKSAWKVRHAVGWQQEEIDRIFDVGFDKYKDYGKKDGLYVNQKAKREFARKLKAGNLGA